ncbi:MAG: hypothetical protein JWO32_280, partial [Bacteroidetes bacterium]|nr:hypothetical protein [Bacteroidota bacterium]
MKKFLFFLSVSTLCNWLTAQTVYNNYVDGQVYVKFSSAALKQVAKEDPTNIPVSKLTSVNKI